MSPGLIGGVVAGLSGLAGLFKSNKSTSTTNFSSSSTPNYDPTNLAFRNGLISQFQNLTNPEVEKQYGDAYTAAGLNNVLAGSEQTTGSVSDALASRGLDRTTAGAGALLDTSNLEAQNAANFQNQATLDLSARNTQNLEAAGGYQASLPVGTNTSGTQTTNSTNGPASPMSGFVGGLASGTAAMLGQQSAANTLGNLLKQYGAQPSPSSYAYQPGPNTSTGSSGISGSSGSNDDWGGGDDGQ